MLKILIKISIEIKKTFKSIFDITKGIVNFQISVYVALHWIGESISF